MLLVGLRSKNNVVQTRDSEACASVGSTGALVTVMAIRLECRTASAKYDLSRVCSLESR